MAVEDNCRARTVGPFASVGMTVDGGWSGALIHPSLRSTCVYVFDIFFKTIGVRSRSLLSEHIYSIDCWRATAGPFAHSTALRVARSVCGHELRVPPLRCASVGMTVGGGWCGVVYSFIVARDV